MPRVDIPPPRPSARPEGLCHDALPRPHPARRTAGPVPSMTPFYFGAPERRLLGLFHPSATAVRGARAVLLCNPFGQEAVRSHRVYRVLAERLARGGIAVLRFD